LAVAPDIDAETASALKGLGAKPHAISMQRSGKGIMADIKYYRELRRVFADFDADLVISYTIKPNIWGSLAAASLKIRSVSMVTGLGFVFSPASGVAGSALRYISQKLYRAATNANSQVIFQNPDDLEDFCAAGCLADRGKAFLVAGSGVDVAHYRRVSLPAEPVFLMISRLLGNKGVREYASAAAIVRRQLPDFRFLLVGFLDEGPDCVTAEELAGWQKNGIEFLGEMKDVRPAIEKASVYVLPSYREGTPRSVLEAMAMGRPVITTDAPGCRETVIDNDNGILVRVGDAQDLADKILKLGGDAALREKMGEAGYRRALSKYEVGGVNREIMHKLQL